MFVEHVKTATLGLSGNTICAARDPQNDIKSTIQNIAIEHYVTYMLKTSCGSSTPGAEGPANLMSTVYQTWLMASLEHTVGFLMCFVRSLELISVFRLQELGSPTIDFSALRHGPFIFQSGVGIRGLQQSQELPRRFHHSAGAGAKRG